MEISSLELLENKYNFKYPTLYKELCEDGMLNTGRYRRNWYKENYPKLKDNPTLLLFSNEVELIEEFQLEEHIDNLEDEEMWSIRTDLKFIPFAQNGGGDLYCFYYNKQEKNNVPIILLSHDSDRFKILSENMQHFIFRILLESYAEFDFSTSDAFTEIQKEEKQKQTERDTKSMFKSHQKYLSEEQNKIIEDILSREMDYYETEFDRWHTITHEKWESLTQVQKDFLPPDTFGFLSKNELKNILKQEIDFPLLDKEMIYV